MNRCEPAEKTEQNPNGIWYRNRTLNIEHMVSKTEKSIKTKLESYFQLSIQSITFWFWMFISVFAFWFFSFFFRSLLCICHSIVCPGNLDSHFLYYYYYIFYSFLFNICILAFSGFSVSEIWNEMKIGCFFFCFRHSFFLISFECIVISITCIHWPTKHIHMWN